MKISVCIPQYNRINFLRRNLEMIAQQTYEHIEVVVSDDCSTDDTEKIITGMQGTYRFPLIYKRNSSNLGYDRNLRQSIELGTGEYCFVLGNDDSFYGNGDLTFLADFLKENKYPDVGYCNYIEDADRAKKYERAQQTGVLGSGYPLALQQFSNFSFVAGLIFKKEIFNKFNTSAYDGSIYTQMYLCSLMIASGCRLFTLKEILVLKDLDAGEAHRNSYRDVIAKKWKDMRVVDGGLPSVIHVLMEAFKNAGVLSQAVKYHIMRRIYRVTYPHWLLDYRSNKALPEAIGMMRGLYPTRNRYFTELTLYNKIRLLSIYYISTIIGLMTPVFLFKKFKPAIYKLLRRK